MTNNKEGPFRHIPGGESLPACWPECPACAYVAGVKAERERVAKMAEVRSIRNGAFSAFVREIRQEPS